MKSSGYTILTVFAMIIILCCSSCNVGKEKEQKARVVAYVAGFRGYDFSTIDASKLTHINYAFANIIGGEVMFDTVKIDNRELSRNDLSVLNGLKTKNPDLKIIISVGGWGWSGSFSDVSLSDSSRRRFAHSAALFIRENNIDGIDLDWEYPNQPGAGNIYRKEDIHNFTLLLKAVREACDSLARAEGRSERYLLTIATGGDSVYVANTELSEVAKYTDFINVMSYDLHNGMTWQAGHHTNLFLSDADAFNGDATDRAVRMHINAGVPPSEINIGIPFYGRMWKGVNPANNGLYQNAATTGQGIPYKNVVDALNDKSFERFWDKSASAPWLWNSKDSVFISYDDAESIAAKMEYIRKMKLGGVMFWEYTEDINGILLNEIDKGIKRTK